jgi:hypothetical protein
MTLRPRYRIGLIAFVAGALACAGDPLSPSGQADQLASALETLSRECNQQGDADGSLAFTYAAMAIRLGVEPSEITMQVGDESRHYLAFVHLVRHGPTASASLRTLVAFRPKTSTDPRPTEVLYVGIPVDSAGIEHPAAAGPAAAATAVWKDLDAGEMWVATAGKAGASIVSAGAACPRTHSYQSLDCSLATFSIFIDGDFYRAIGGSESNLEPNPVLGIRARSSAVNGATMVFAD